MLAFWNRLSPGARLGFGTGVLVVLGLAVWLAVATLRTPYGVLFTGMTEPDAATVLEQLRRLKVPYRIAGDGTTLLVPAGQVRETRLRLMSSGMPLAGAVGFEIFDKQGLGVTEQSQRVSYQRALQGELARTIGAMEDVKQARVHLVLPESTLFKRDRQEARAAVSLTLKAGAALSPAQILGIQRLVAASVAALNPGQVVITDQRGVTLSGTDALGPQESEAGGGSEARLAMKREVEDGIRVKVARLLEGTYGAGQVLVSVDAQLNFDQVHQTIQDIRPLRDNKAGAVRHKRQVVSRASRQAALTPPGDKDSAPSPGSSTLEVDYEYGRSTEEVTAALGSISRLSIGVVVPGSLSPEKRQRITDLVRAAAGVHTERGDTIVVQPVDELVSRPESPPALPEVPPVAASVEPAPSARALVLSGSLARWVSLGLLLLLGVGAWAWARQRPSVPRLTHDGPPLSDKEREQLLLEIQQALSEPDPIGDPADLKARAAS